MLLSLVVMGAVLAPLARDASRDGFPLSTYPMFAESRRDTKARIRHVVAHSREGRHRPVPHELVDTEEVMQAHQTIDAAIKGGDATALALCERAAVRVAEADGFADIDELEVRSDHYDVLTYFEGERRPYRTRVHARCRVPREDGR